MWTCVCLSIWPEVWYSLVPMPLPLKTWEWHGDEAIAMGHEHDHYYRIVQYYSTSSSIHAHAVMYTTCRYMYIVYTHIMHNIVYFWYIFNSPNYLPLRNFSMIPQTQFSLMA